MFALYRRYGNNAHLLGVRPLYSAETQMYNSILLPMDGRTNGDSAIERAIAVAIDHDATLHVVQVVDTTATVHGSMVTPGEILAELDPVERDVLECVRRKANRAGVRSVMGSVARGRPHEVVLDYANERNIDLIVMPSPARSALDRVYAGDHTQRIISEAPVPVLVADSETDRKPVV